MKLPRLILRIVLLAAIIFLAIVCVKSVLTPIQFDETREAREVAVKENLGYLRIAQEEYLTNKGRYTTSFDTLLTFLKTTPKKEISKEGSLTEKQLENGLTENKAMKIINTAKAKARKKLKTNDDATLTAYINKNDKDVISKGLVGFRRDTIYENMIEMLYKGAFDAKTIDKIVYIPYTDKKRFELETNNDYETSNGAHIPLLEIRAPFTTYLGDLDAQELVNLIDKETKLDHYAGLKIGSLDAPNKNAGNW